MLHHVVLHEVRGPQVDDVQGRDSIEPRLHLVESLDGPRARGLVRSDAAEHHRVRQSRLRDRGRRHLGHPPLVAACVGCLQVRRHHQERGRGAVEGVREERGVVDRPFRDLRSGLCERLEAVAAAADGAHGHARLAQSARNRAAHVSRRAHHCYRARHGRHPSERHPVRSAPAARDLSSEDDLLALPEAHCGGEQEHPGRGASPRITWSMSTFCPIAGTNDIHSRGLEGRHDEDHLPRHGQEEHQGAGDRPVRSRWSSLEQARSV